MRARGILCALILGLASGTAQADAVQAPTVTAPAPISISRLRFCARKWDDMKHSGAADGLFWKQFAEKCMKGGAGD